MRNSLHMVLDRTTNQLIVVPQSPAPLPRQTGEGLGVGADLDTINDRCAAVRLNVLASAAQRNMPRRSAWEAADHAAGALRQQLLQGQVPA